MVEVNEVICRSTQGMSQPFICRDESGRKLWVKGSGWRSKELAAEWICAQLAREWGLPLADFSLVSVDDDLIRYSAISDIASLGAGIGFGSFHEDGAGEVNYLDIPKIDEELRADILLFDYWVQNGDRMLEPCGGNPNLLWHAAPENVVMIDHNGAFEDNFLQVEFFKTHIFRESLAAWGESFRKNRQQKILELLGKLPDICALLPEAWYDDNELTGFSAELARMKQVLSRIEKDPNAFWEVSL